jgi:hypothetical protein
MPATRQSKRKSTKKAKVEAAPVEEARVEEPSAQEEPHPLQGEDASMSVDSNPEVVQPEASSSKGVEGPSIAEKVGETVEEAMDVAESGVKKVAGKAGEVIAAAGEFVDEMNGIEESNGSRSKEDSPESKGKSRSQSAEVEEEEGSKQKLSLDERRAKMEALRKKMVCFIH